MSELSPLGGSEREGELAQRAKRGRPGAYGACDDEGASHVAARGRTLCAPTDSAYPVWRGLLDAPYLLPGGKVAFAEQMTDEGAEGRTVHYLRDYPHQSALRLTDSP